MNDSVGINHIFFFRKKNTHKTFDLSMLKKYSIYWSIIYSSIIFVLVYRINGVIWEGSDDFTISQLLMGASGEKTPYVSVCSFYLCKFIVYLQNVLPVVNWFTIFEIISVWLFFVVGECFLLKRVNGFVDCAKALAFPLIFEPIFFSNLEYTRTAFLYTFAGLLVIYDIIVYNRSFNDNVPEKKFKSICGIFIGGLLFVMGTMFRYMCFGVSIVYIIILISDNIIMRVKNRYNNSCIYRILCFATVILSLVVFSSQVYNNNTEVYDRFNEENEWISYNKAQSDVVDYIPPEYIEDFSMKSPFISENDFFMLKHRMNNDAFFSKDYYKQVKNVFECYFNKVKMSSSKYNIMQLFYSRTGRNSGNRTQFFVLMILSITSLVCFADNNRWMILFDVFLTCGMIGYFLLQNRLPPWVLDPMCLMASFVLFVKSYKENETVIPSKSIIKKSVFFVGIIICIFLNMRSEKEMILLATPNTDLRDAIQFAEESSEAFLLDLISYCPYPYIDLYGPLACYKEGQWDNIIRVGNWDVEHPERNRQKAELGIESVIYSLVDEKSYLITSSDVPRYDVYKKFFSEHYNEDIDFVCIENFGDYGIYKVIKNNKELCIK